MSHRFGTDNWTLAVPGGWEAWHEEECSTLVGPEEIGALQLSGAIKDSNVLDEDLLCFASEHLAAGAHATKTQFGTFEGFEIAFSSGDRYWRQWFMRHGRVALFVTYNCDVAFRGLEDAAVEEALASLKASVEDAP